MEHMRMPLPSTLPGGRNEPWEQHYWEGQQRHSSLPNSWDTWDTNSCQISQISRTHTETLNPGVVRKWLGVLYLSWSICWSASYIQNGLSMVVHSVMNSMEPPVSAEMSQMARSLQGRRQHSLLLRLLRLAPKHTLILYLHILSVSVPVLGYAWGWIQWENATTNGQDETEANQRKISPSISVHCPNGTTHRGTEPGYTAKNK